MKTIRLKKHAIIGLCALLTSAPFVLAQATFQTNLLKTEISKTPIGTIKVIIYTNKHYSDAITVNKKNDLEYVILMPETANASTSKPSLATVSDTVKNVEIKTQQYEEHVKGYTKITLRTSKAIEITPQVKVLTSTETKLSDKDYKELLAQATSKKTPAAKTPTQKAVSTTQNTKKLTSTAAPVSKKQEAKIKQVKTEPKIVKQVAKQIEKPQPKKQVEKTKVMAKAQPIAKPVEQKPAATPVASEPTVKVPIPAELATQKDLATHPDVITPEEPKQIKTEAKPVAKPKLRKIQKIKNIIKKGAKVIENNIYTFAAIMATALLILLVIVRRKSKNHQAQKEIFKAHLDEKPEHTTNLNEKIDENMDWQEKFQTYVDAEKEFQEQPSQGQEEPQPSSEIEELDDLFGYTEHVDNINEEQIYETGFEEIQDYSFEESDVSVEDLFSDNEAEETTEDYFAPIDETVEENIEDIETEEIEVEEEDELVKSEFSIDAEKGFYLVDFEDKTTLVGHIEDEIFVLKAFDEKIDVPIQARLSEKKGNAAHYMTKVGGFKGIVEVTSDKMNLLIEL